MCIRDRAYPGPTAVPDRAEEQEGEQQDRGQRPAAPSLRLRRQPTEYGVDGGVPGLQLRDEQPADPVEDESGAAEDGEYAEDHPVDDGVDVGVGAQGGADTRDAPVVPAADEVPPALAERCGSRPGARVGRRHALSVAVACRAAIGERPWSTPGSRRPPIRVTPDGGRGRCVSRSCPQGGRYGGRCGGSVSYTHLRAHETDSYLVCRLLLEK